MASEGPNSPGTVISDGSLGGVVSWINPSNAAASDDTYAIASGVNDEETPETLIASDLGFAIPTGATINGIEVAVAGKVEGGDTTGFTFNALLFLGGVLGFDYYDIQNEWVSDAGKSVITFGGASNLWGATLTAEDINDPLFAVGVGQGFASSGYCDVSVDHITMTVYYTAAPSSAIATLNGVARASVATVNGLAIASVGSVNGLA